MPQFDSTFWLSQIFWLSISFLGLYIGVHFIVFPAFQRIFDKRDKQIQDVLKRAEKLTQETEDLEKETERKNKALEQHQKMHLVQAHQKAFHQMEQTLKKTEADLIKALQKKIRQMENEEKNALRSMSDFVKAIMKGTK